MNAFTLLLVISTALFSISKVANSNNRHLNKGLKLG
mgnify:CR=1 FL=1